MDAIFFLIRLPFFISGVVLWAAVGYVAVVIAVVIGVFVVCIALPLWLVILLPGSVVVAALSNDSKAVASFLRWTWDDIIGEASKWLRATVLDYFRSYSAMGKWLVGE